MPEVTATFLLRRVQPPQQRYHPIWEFNGEDDSTQAITMPFADRKALAVVLADFYHGDQQAFATMKLREGYSANTSIALLRVILLRNTPLLYVSKN